MPFYTVQKTPAAPIQQESSSQIIALQGSDPLGEENRHQEESSDSNELPSYDSLVPPPSTLFKPQSIVIDHSLIFPSEPPSEALYQLNHDLDSGNSVAIGRIDHVTSESSNGSPRVRIRDRPIYTFSHRIFNDKVIEILGKRKDGFSYLLMTKHSSFGSIVWKVCIANSAWKEQATAMIQCKSSTLTLGKSDLAFKWVDGAGKTVAVEYKQNRRSESRDGKSLPKNDPDQRHVLNISQQLEQKAVDVLVTAWCARVWHDALETNKAPLTPKEGEK